MRFCEEAQQNIHNNVYEMIRQQRKVVLHVYHKPMKIFVRTMKKATERLNHYEKVQWREGSVTKGSTGKRNRYEMKPASMMK